MKENKKVFTEEQTKEIEDIIEDKNTSSLVFVLLWVLIIASFNYIIWYGFNTIRHNSDVDQENKQLAYCKSIYDSDHVVLQQCKDYFVIIGEDGNVR